MSSWSPSCHRPRAIEPDNAHSSYAMLVVLFLCAVKGVNFFGLGSEYVVSGSDCGNIYFWDTESEKIVQYMRGDYEGVVSL